jgi:GntR family transcriptional regulator, transcriptional repressor for pyruvate dehydrogenase complex
MVVKVVDRLTDAIVKGKFDRSSVLPSEAELASSFGVSRTVVREAMRSLRAQGLVQASKGRVARVAPPDSKATVASLRLLLRRNKASLLHLMQVRKPLEGEIAMLAAERANDEHIRQLEQSIHDLDGSLPLESRTKADMRFHRILAEATGNPVFVLLLETLAEFFLEFHQKTLDSAGVKYARAGHLAVLDAVRKREPLEALGAMQAHLRTAEKYLLSRGVTS